MNTTYSETLSSFVADLSYEHIPGEVISNAKLRILDVIGACLPVGKMDFAQPILRASRTISGKPECSIIGTNDKFPVALGALINGTHAHSLDFDDTHTNSTTHGSSCIVPSVLAVGERRGSTGKEVITAAVAGWEAIVRLGDVAPSRLTVHGFRPTAICGTFAAALITGKLLGLSPGTLAQAMGISGSFASGLNEFMTDGLFDTKRVHSGWAAHSGVTAALLAEQGFTGPSTILEGEFGIYKSHLNGEDYNLGRITEGLGDVWETLNTSFKPYPACHFMHAFIDCASELKHEVQPENIDKVLVRVAEPIVGSICEPRSVKVPPRNDYEAKFSLQFAVAAMLVDKKVTVETFLPEKITDPDILAIAQKVEHTVDPNAPFPQSYPGWVEIMTKDGRKLEHKQDITRGTPEFPMTRQELHDKFRGNAGMVLPKERVEEILNTIDRLEELENVSQLMRLCQL